MPHKNIIKAAVIGDPISHSLSPKLHNFWLQKYKIQGSYEAIRVKDGELEKAVKSMISDGYAGFNITIPHKEKIFQICAQKTPNAALTKAVNTVTITTEHKLHGDNSDCDGFLKNLHLAYPDFLLQGKNAFVIGSGGAARAVVYALLSSQVKNIFLTNRNIEKAQNLIADFAIFIKQQKAQIHFLDEKTFAKNLTHCDLLINATSLGMVNQPALEIDLKNLQKSAIVYDIVYKPLMTNLLIEAEKRGNKIVTGISMLAFQAAIGFEVWFKKKPEINNELLQFLIKEACQT